MRGGWGRKAARCGLPRFLRPLGRSQCLRGWGARWGVRGMPRFAACRVSCGLWAARNACAVRGAGGVGACRVLQPAAFLAAFRPARNALRGGALGRGGHAALCGLPRFLRPLGRSQRLREGALGREGACRALRLAAFLAAFGPLATLAGWGAGAWGGMPRFAAYRVSCGLWAARNACGVGCGGVGYMRRFAACRVSCGLWAARNACAYCAAAQGFGALPQTPARA